MKRITASDLVTHPHNRSTIIFNLEFQFESEFNSEFQPKFGIQLGILIPMGINLGECTITIKMFIKHFRMVVSLYPVLQGRPTVVMNLRTQVPRAPRVLFNNTEKKREPN